ncbi:hypothetical protein [Actibacterium ureilyticum]|uniref:hypothetical protein n=1 Tax=Actibacterium ureilyticum TaxID=1590614 RepID=UPI000BAB20AA|nr:hypothetical protein [Actibacterium ureilyticum]
MRRFIVLVGLLALVALAALVTKPGADDAEAHLSAILRAQVDRQDIAQQDDVIGTAALIGCKLRPGDCVDLLRRGIDMTVTDHTLYTRVDIDGFDRQARCYGAFGRFWCPGSGDMTGAEG